MIGVYQATATFWKTKDSATMKGMAAGRATHAASVIANVATTPKVVEIAKAETEATTMAIATPTWRNASAVAGETCGTAR